MGVRVEASSKCSLSPYQHRHYAATEHDHGDVGGGELASGGEGEEPIEVPRFLSRLSSVGRLKRFETIEKGWPGPWGWARD